MRGQRTWIREAWEAGPRCCPATLLPYQAHQGGAGPLPCCMYSVPQLSSRLAPSSLSGICSNVTSLGGLPSPPTTFLCFVFLHNPHPFGVLGHLLACLLPAPPARIRAGILVCWTQDPGLVVGSLWGGAVKTGMSE